VLVAQDYLIDRNCYFRFEWLLCSQAGLVSPLAGAEYVGGGSCQKHRTIGAQRILLKGQSNEAGKISGKSALEKRKDRWLDKDNRAVCKHACIATAVSAKFVLSAAYKRTHGQVRGDVRFTPIVVIHQHKWDVRLVPCVNDFELARTFFMLRYGRGFKLAMDGIDTRAIQDYWGHKFIANSMCYSRLWPE
jgi:hypothetical protein